MRIPTIRQRAQMTISGAQGHTTIPEDSWAHLRVRYHLLHPYGAGCLDSQGHLVQPGSASACVIGWWAHGWEGVGMGLGQEHRSGHLSHSPRKWELTMAAITLPLLGKVVCAVIQSEGAETHLWSNPCLLLVVWTWISDESSLGFIL